jgi:hypothetical protein
MSDSGLDTTALSDWLGHRPLRQQVVRERRDAWRSWDSDAAERVS